MLQNARVDIPVDAFLRDGEAVFVGHHDVMDGLAQFEASRQDVAYFTTFLLGNAGTLPRVDKKFPVVGFRNVMDIVFLPEYTFVLLGTSITHIRGHVKFFADILTKVRTQFITFFTSAAPFAALEIPAHIYSLAVMSMYAAVRQAPECTFITVSPMFKYFTCNGGMRLADVKADFSEQSACSKTVLDELSLGMGQVCHEFAPDCWVNDHFLFSSQACSFAHAENMVMKGNLRTAIFHA